MTIYFGSSTDEDLIAELEQRGYFCAKAQEPVSHRYRFIHPISGEPVWRDSSSTWNGQCVQEVQPLFAAPVPPVRELVMANNDEVICPSCCNQFRAIPVNVQRLMLDAGFKPPFKSVPCGYKLVPITLLERALQAISATMFGTETYYKSSRGDFTNVVEKEIRAIIEAEHD